MTDSHHRTSTTIVTLLLAVLMVCVQGLEPLKQSRSFTPTTTTTTDATLTPTRTATPTIACFHPSFYAVTVPASQQFFRISHCQFFEGMNVRADGAGLTVPTVEMDSVELAGNITLQGENLQYSIVNTTFTDRGSMTIRTGSTGSVLIHTLSAGFTLVGADSSNSTSYNITANHNRCWYHDHHNISIPATTHTFSISSCRFEQGLTLHVERPQAFLLVVIHDVYFGGDTQLHTNGSWVKFEMVGIVLDGSVTVVDIQPGYEVSHLQTSFRYKPRKVYKDTMDREVHVLTTVSCALLAVLLPWFIRFTIHNFPRHDLVEQVWGMKPLVANKLVVAAEVFDNIQLQTSNAALDLRNLVEPEIEELTKERLATLLINHARPAQALKQIQELPTPETPQIRIRRNELLSSLANVNGRVTGFSFVGNRIFASEFTAAFLRKSFKDVVHHADITVEGWTTGFKEDPILVNATPLFMFCLGKSGGSEFTPEEFESFKQNFFPEGQNVLVNPVHVVQRAPSLLEHNHSFEPLTPYDLILYQATATSTDQSSGCAKKVLGLMEKEEPTRKAFQDVFSPRLLTSAAAMIVIVVLSLVDAIFLNPPRTTVHENYLKEIANSCLGRYMSDPRLLYNETMPLSTFNRVNPSCPLHLQSALFLKRSVRSPISLVMSYFSGNYNHANRTSSDDESLSYVRALYFYVDSAHLFKDFTNNYTIFMEVALDWNVQPQPQYIKAESLIRNDMTTQFAFRYWQRKTEDSSVMETICAIGLGFFVPLVLSSSLRTSSHSLASRCSRCLSLLDILLITGLAAILVFVLVGTGFTSLVCCSAVALISSLFAMVNEFWATVVTHKVKGYIRPQEKEKETAPDYAPRDDPCGWLRNKRSISKVGFPFDGNQSSPIHLDTLCLLGRYFCKEGSFFPPDEELYGWLLLFKDVNYDSENESRRIHPLHDAK